MCPSDSVVLGKLFRCNLSRYPRPQSDGRDDSDEMSRCRSRRPRIFFRWQMEIFAQRARSMTVARQRR